MGLCSLFVTNLLLTGLHFFLHGLIPSNIYISYCFTACSMAWAVRSVHTATGVKRKLCNTRRLTFWLSFNL